MANTVGGTDFRRLTDEQIDNIINEELGELQRYAVVYMERLMEQYKISAGGLSGSLRAEVVEVSRDAYAEMVINFRGYGRYRDMRTLNFGGGVPDIGKLKDWVLNEVGVENFEFIPGYTKSSRAWPTKERAAERIAWGVAYSLNQRGLTRRRGRGFYNQGRSRSINRFRREVSERIMAAVLAAVADGVSAEL